MEDQNQPILNNMEETRTALTEKLEALEEKIVEKVQPIATAVERAAEAAADIVEDVKESVHEVKGRVERTAHSVWTTLNVRRHTERHPWAVVGVAATIGCVLGSLGRRPRAVSEPGPAVPRRKQGKTAGNGLAHRSVSDAEPKPQGLFAEELNRLKALAIGSALAVVRDLAKQTLPEAIGDRLAEEIDSLTVRLGSQPIAGPVLHRQDDDRAHSEQMSESRNRFRAG
jgi:ElaB/YqjD/DUF883 family membrane-anchored ribosome-binding protein